MSKAAVSEVMKMGDDCSTLLLLHAAEQGLTATKPRVTSRFFYPEVLRGRHWLMVYEGLWRGWVTPPAGMDYIGRDAVFDFLRQQDVHFYETTKIDEQEEEEEEEEVVPGYAA